MMNRKPELGDIACDLISGFEGIVTSTTQWLNGCERVLIQPQQLHDGKIIEPQWFDVQQVKVKQHAAFFALCDDRDGKAQAVGGPMNDPSPPRDPTR